MNALQYQASKAGQEVTLDELVTDIASDSELATDAILIGLATGGFTAGGIELLAASEIQRRLDNTAAQLEKTVGPARTLIRQAFKHSVMIAGGLAGVLGKTFSDFYSLASSSLGAGIRGLGQALGVSAGSALGDAATATWEAAQHIAKPATEFIAKNVDLGVLAPALNNESAYFII